MKITRFALTAVLWIGLLEATPAATNYVAQAGQTPASPYTNWTTAASNIQDAISVATNAGDTVLVSNGVYQTGGVTNWPAGTILTNRVAITNAITVRAFSTNPADTLIKGAWDPVTTNGPAAVRCVYMANGSALIGFTLTNGATWTNGYININDYGGGIHCLSINTVISNCVLTGNSAGYAGGGAVYSTLYNCTLIGNSASYQGGGVAEGTLFNCTISGNSSALYGGGTYFSTLTNCTIVGNHGGDGGGAYAGTLYNCTIVSNSATYSGGVGQGTLYNCTLTGNSALSDGGGTRGGTYYNCTIVGNSASQFGGGTSDGTYYNCTIVGNYTGGQGGGAFYGTYNNCIIYFNTAPDGSNWYGTVSFTNSCTTTAQVGWAAGNITNDPTFITNGSGYGTNHVAGNYRLRSGSPCINTGTNQAWMINGQDLDQRPRIREDIVDMGAYEWMLKGTVFSFGGN